MIFRQLFEPLSSTYTYLIGCEETGAAVLIDPVVNAIERDLDVLSKLQLRLDHTIDTHVHADHITSALHLKQRTGCQIAAPALERLSCADVQLEDGKPLRVGSIEIAPIHTPGHTDTHFAYVWADKVFTGDALLIDGCGRTDFQNGDSAALYRSVRERLFTLPDDQLVYPCHDYNQRRVSTIAQERSRNPRLGGERTLEEFIQLMAELKLPYPKFIDYAVPGNKRCGVCPNDLDERLQAYCKQMEHTPQG
jgi:sulfur dioxygenase